MINVTKPYLPDRNKLNEYIDGIYNTVWLTNNGPLVRELTERLKQYLGVDNLLLVSNATTALQIAYKVLGITGKAITTPFSFVATTSSLVWVGIEPTFVDIDSESLCIDPSKIESAVTPETTAIVPVHVFGNACDVEKIEDIAHKYGLKTIYDGAHAFGVQYKGKSISSYGDATILSFQATKLFHTIEGGAIIFKNIDDYNKAKKMIYFGIDGSDLITEVGINGKMNEFQAAMGLCVLDSMDTILEERAKIWHQYYRGLRDYLKMPHLNSNASNNFIYFPVIFESEEVLLKVKEIMNNQGINPRRYFYPSLDTLSYLHTRSEKRVSRDISSRILCLPIYPGLEEYEAQSVIEVVKSSLIQY